MTDEQVIRELAQQSLDQTVIDGSHVATDPQSYIFGYTAGFATVEYSRNVLDDDQLQAVKAQAWAEGNTAGANRPNPYAHQ